MKNNNKNWLYDQSNTQFDTYDTSNKIIFSFCKGLKKIQVIGTKDCRKYLGLGINLKSNCWSGTCTECSGTKKVAYYRTEMCHHCKGNGFLCY